MRQIQSDQISAISVSPQIGSKIDQVRNTPDPISFIRTTENQIVGNETVRARTLSELQRELTGLRKQVFGVDMQASSVMLESEAESATQIAFVESETSKVTLAAAVNSTPEKAIATE